MKNCTRCKVEKENTEFRLVRKNGTDRIAKCRLCEREYKIEQYQIHKDTLLDKNKLYREENKDRINVQRKGYREKNKEEISKKCKEWRLENLDHVKEEKRIYYANNKDKMDAKKRCHRLENIDYYKDMDRKRHLANRETHIQQMRDYYQSNRSVIRKQRAAYYQNNKDKIRAQRKRWLDNNPQAKIGLAARARVRTQLKSGKGYLTLLDCDLDFCRSWFEFQFQIDGYGFCWENYGKVWHIDHVTPCASFDMKNKQDRLECFSWRNLAPVYKKYNYSKGKKIVRHDILRQEIRVYLFIKSLSHTGEASDTAAVGKSTVQQVV